MTTQTSFLRTLAISVTAFGCAVGLLLPASLNIVHGSGLDRSGKTSGNRVHVTALLVSDSPEGSRVLITADQPLSSYEAYRRGDRFYVSIPLSKISCVDSIRARSFTDIKVEQTSAGTLVSFLLMPGVTVRANLYGYQLEIVFAASRTRTIVPVTIARKSADSNTRVAPTQKNGVWSVNATAKTRQAAVSKATYTPARNFVSAKSSSSAAKPERKIEIAHSSINTTASVTREQDETPVIEESSDKVRESSDAASTGLVSSVNHVATAVTVAAPNSHWDRGKDSANYWLQVARLNPLPVAGGAFLLLLIGLLIRKRRKAERMPATEPLAEPPQCEPEMTTEAVTIVKVIGADATPQIPKTHTEDRVAHQAAISDAIGKLVLDNTHRADIMDSRSPKDRKAIEACLIKVITATESSDNDRRRARQALEEYGFVAQHSAALLKGADAWERSSAARTLGLIGSKASLSFLIEALNDSDCVVRNEAVASLAALKDPAAIGALLEAARKHPDVPATLLSATLSACSVESFETPDVPPSGAASMTGAVKPRNDDSQWPERPQEGADDDVLSGWLALLDNPYEDSCTNEVLEVPMPAQIAKPIKDRPYLRVVA